MTAEYTSIMMLPMTRTTVTLDPDVEQLLRDVMQHRRQSFKEALNQAIRSGLTNRQRGAPEPPFVAQTHAMGELRSGIDPLRLNQMVDELEVDAFITSTARLARREKGARRPRQR